MRRTAYASVAVLGLLPATLQAQWPFSSSASQSAPPAAQVPAPSGASAVLPQGAPGAAAPATTPLPATGSAPMAGPLGASGPVPIGPAGVYTPPKPATNSCATSGCGCCSTGMRPSNQYRPATSLAGGFGAGTVPTSPQFGGYPSAPVQSLYTPTAPGGAAMPASYREDGQAVAVARSTQQLPPTAPHAGYQGSAFDQLPVAAPADTSAAAVPEKPSWWRRVILRQRTVTPSGDEFEGNFSSTPPENVPYDTKPIVSEEPKPSSSGPGVAKRMFGWLPFVR